MGAETAIRSTSSARLLDEMFFPPFKAAITQAHARSVMSAYNSVDGLPATQNRPLLTDKLRREWGFTGFVISDAAATGGATVLHHTEASTATATTRRAQRRPRRHLSVVVRATSAISRRVSARTDRCAGDRLRRRSRAASEIRARVVRASLRRRRQRRVLERQCRASRARARSGARVDRVAAQRARRSAADEIDQVDRRHRRRRVRGAARRIQRSRDSQGLDRRRNPREAWPNGRGSIRRGPRSCFPRRTLSFLQRIFMHAPAAIRCADCAANTSTTIASKGSRASFASTSASTSGGRSTRRRAAFRSTGIRRAGRARSPFRAAACTQIGIEGNDGYRLWIDDKLVIDNWRKVSVGRRMATVNLARGTEHAIRLEYFESTGNARLKLVWDAGVSNTWRAQNRQRLRRCRAERRRSRGGRTRGGRVSRSRISRSCRDIRKSSSSESPRQGSLSSSCSWAEARSR